MKIVYMGTPDFAVPPLAALVKAGYEVTAVVTQPDKPKGRGKTPEDNPGSSEIWMYQHPCFPASEIQRCSTDPAGSH